MGSPAPEQLYWIIEPLVDAGVDLEQITVLLYRLGFEAILDGGRATVAAVTDLVSDQPMEVQAAWHCAVGRMIADPGPAEQP